MKSYVYFIRNGHGSVKIGVTAKPESRAYSLSQGSDTPLELVRSVEGGRRAEAWFHEHFAEHRLYGEWFKFVPEMMTVEADLQFEDEQTGDARRGTTIPIDIYQSMAEGGKSQSEIAQALGVSRQAVHQVAKRHAIKMKSGIAPADTTYDAEVIRLTGAGQTAMEIAETIGIYAGKVRLILARHCIKANKPAPRSKYEAAMRDLAASGCSLVDAARQLGIHQPGAHSLAKRLDIKFADGRKMKKQ
mgnify:CR=1 FL=1